MRIGTIALLTSLIFSLANTVHARASDDDDEESSSSRANSDTKEGDDSDETPGKTEGADVRVEGKEAEKELDPGEIERAKQAEVANSPIEKKGKTYYFVGLRYRGLLLPKFMMTIFGDGGTSVYSNGFGPEFTVRKDDFEYVLSAWFVDYYMPNTPFKAKNDPETSWEMVKSNMSALYLTSDFNWSHHFAPAIGMFFGLGAGFAFTWGDLTRTEAYKGADGEYHKCTGEFNPNATYCGQKSADEQYNYKEKNWIDGGSKPIVFPWLALQTGLRIKPHRNFMARIDLGWAITGPFFGISGNYGI